MYPRQNSVTLQVAAGCPQLTIRGELHPAPLDAPLEESTREFCQGPLAHERAQTLQSEESRQTSLFVYAIGGGLAVALSLLVIQLKPVAPGLMLGGIASFFIAGVHVWTLNPGIGRLVTIVIIFLVLVGIGIYTLRDHE